jgi:glutaconate CoA-transferase subunit B
MSSSHGRPDGGCGEEELLADALSRLIGDARHVAVGMASPIPATAALLARERGRGMPVVSLLQSRDDNEFTDGGGELFDCAGQGRVDVFFLSGAQIDGQANINLVCLGDYRRPTRRFAGSFGASYLYFMVPRVILFRREHTRRTLVEKVDFLSAPGVSPPNVFRRGGPVALVTGRAVFAFDRARRRFRLQSVHPGHRTEDVLEHTGFAFELPHHVPTTQRPSPETLRVLHRRVVPRVATVYPRFAATVFGFPQLPPTS